MTLRSFRSGATRWAMTTTTSNRSCTISGLANGTSYYFEVRARNSAGTSPASNTVTATPNAGIVSCGAGQLYFSRYGGCRPTSCSSGRDSTGYCLHVPLPPPVRLVGLEVTQGLQNLKGEVTLVKGKRTVVRAFLEPVSGKGRY